MDSSHHRLPYGEYQAVGDSKPSLLKKSHVRFSENSDYRHDLRLNLRPAKSPSRPWQQDVRWLKQVSHCSERIRHWFTNHQTLISNPEWMDAFIRLITHFGRTGMMCADHSVSAKDNDKPSRAQADALIANTARGGPGSILGTHLVNVGRQASSLTRALWQQHLGMPFVAREDIPAPMRPDAGESAVSAFAWQDAACKFLKAVAKAGVDTGFIGFVQAGTGCGKTRACARMMAALSSDVRYTVALGLRTLTLQTGQSYRDELELTRQQVTTMVGESLVTRLQEKAEKQGSESRSAWFDGELTIDGESCDDDLPRALADMLEGADKHKRLLTAPVLVCTADHITAAADASRGRHLIATLRVFSADLVLDEIDNYEERALVALGKLIYLAGLAGRRVLLSSATLSPAISESLFQAYFEGYRAYAQRRAIEEPQIATGWFSQFEALCQVKWFRKKDVFSPTSSMKKFVRQQVAYAKSLVAAMDTIPVKRSIEWLSLPTSCDMKGLVQCIYQAGQTLHHKFAGTDPVTGKRLSFGLIRGSNITPCWQISRLLCEQKSENQWDHRVVCYHARLSALARWHTEQWLDKTLNRKQPDAVWQLPLIRKLLDSSSARNIMIMVVATPVEEVGRDHDFDWGIFEPASTRSGVQSGGRIWRHRQPAGQTDNIVLLPTAIKEILKPGQNAVYQYPGVESNPDYLLSTHQAQALLPEDWQVRLDARHNLITPSDSVAEMTSLEHKKQRDYLLGQASDRLSGKTRDSQAAGYSLSEWSVKPALGFCDRHAFGNPFRTREDKVLYWINENGYWWHMIMNVRGQPKDKKDPVSADTQIDSITVPDNRLLMNTIIPAHEWPEHYRVLKDKAYPDASKEYAEQSLLGFEFPHSSNRQPILYHFWLGATRESIKI